MPKLTINDTDYYTEDFNETQTKLYNEVMLARIAYMHQVLTARRENLAGMIVEAAKEPQVDDAKDEPEA